MGKDSREGTREDRREREKERRRRRIRGREGDEKFLKIGAYE